MSRAVRVYRLDVEVPPESLADPDWRPDGYLEDDPWARHVDADGGSAWSWPPRRHYLSASAAQARKALLERWGAKVELVVSERVVFP